MSYKLQDSELLKTKALPAANASAATAAMDLGARTAKASRLEEMEFEVSVPATPDLVEDKTVILTIETDDDSAFGSATAVHTAIITVTGAGAAAGGAAASQRFRLPTDNLERYIRATAAVLASGGDNTGVSFTLKALF